MLELYKKLHAILTKNERKQASILFVLLLISALVETLGVASIMPFISVLSDPSIIHRNSILSRLYVFFSFEDDRAFMIFMGVSVFFVLIGTIITKAFTSWAQIRFSFMRNHTLGVRLVSGYLYQPYAWFLENNSSKLMSNVLLEVNKVVSSALFPALQLIARIFSIFCILMLLMIIDPFLTISAIVLLAALYSIIFVRYKEYLARLGTDRWKSNRARIVIAAEAFGGIKDVKARKLENSFLRRFMVPSSKIAIDEIKAQMIAMVPNYLLQAVIFGGMILVILYLLMSKGSFQNALPVISVFAFAIYRIMPALQDSFRCMTELKFSTQPVESVYKDLVKLNLAHTEVPDEIDEGEDIVPLLVEKEIRLQNITFTYSTANKPAIANLTMVIPAKTTVGFVGLSGSGKTTTADLLLKLLTPECGTLLVDDVPITEANIAAWARAVGYVPQSIFLTDDTIKGNIAFGVPYNEIDNASVVAAAKAANLYEFIISDLEQGFDTIVGERGTRLSGGQQQRIGIARALYFNPTILVLDEATSALDNITEQAFIDTIYALSQRKTIIIIAHRLSTIQKCDEIFVFSNGSIIDSGKFEELSVRCPDFKKLTQSSKEKSI